MPGTDQLAPERVGEAFVRNEHGAAGQRPGGRQRADGSRQLGCRPDDDERPSVSGHTSWIIYGRPDREGHKRTGRR
jgi:hypothetical protein